MSDGGENRVGIRDRIEAGFESWGHSIYRHAWLAIGGVLAVTVALATQLPNIHLDTSTESFLHEGDPARVTYNEFRSRFGRDDLILVAVRPPEIFDFGFLEKLRNLHREIEDKVPHIHEVTSLVNARDTRGVEDTLLVGELLEDWPEDQAALDAIRERVESNPLLTDMLVSADGTITTILIETDAYSSKGEEDALAGFDDDDGVAEQSGVEPAFLTGDENEELVAALMEIIRRYEAPDFPIYAAGAPVMTDHLQLSMRRDMARFTLIAIGAIALFLAVLFRRAAGVVVPLVIVVVSLVTTLSIMAIMGINLSLPTQILPSFLLAVGVGASVHVLVIFYQGMAGGRDKEGAIAYALGHSGLAIVMTSLTTAGGLISFATAELMPIADFGVAAPIGVMVALVFTLVLLPALVSVFPVRGGPASESASTSFTRRALVRTGDFATSHATSIVAATAGILVIALLGAFQIRFSHSPLEWFPVEDPFRVASELMNDKMGGAMFIELLFDSGRENGVHEPEFLNRLDAMRRSSARIQVGDITVGKTVSLADVVKEIHKALNENRSEFYAVPDQRELVAQELILFENSGSDDLLDFADPQFREARFTMKLPFVDAIQYGDFLAAVDTGISAAFPEGDTKVTITGLWAIMGRIFTAVMYSMAKSYVIALLVITPLMVLLIGRVGLGLLSMIPNVTPIIMTLGIMGWAGIPLDAFTLLIGSIAIGLAVDDTIHFMHNFRRYWEVSRDPVEAVRRTLDTTGQAMLFTSLVLSTGFFLYMFASMNNLFYFGLLTGITIVTAFIADVVLSPALMTLATRSRSVGAANAHTMETAS